VAKLILLSVVIFTVVIPILFSGSKSPKRVLRTIQVATVVCVAVWAFLCLTWYPALVPLE
jgi:hypothetical protein